MTNIDQLINLAEEDGITIDLCDEIEWNEKLIFTTFAVEEIYAEWKANR